MIICICGKIGTGKSSLRIKLQEKINFYGVSVSDFLKSRSKTDNRESLQELGSYYIKRGFYYFVKEFLSFVSINDNIIIDGIRHIQFYNELKKQCFPNKVVLVYIETDEKTRQQRIENRNKDSYINEKSLAEGNLELIKQVSDIIVDNTSLTIDQTMDFILDKLNHRDLYYSIQDIKNKVLDFNNLRGWMPYQNALNVAISISIEANELLENFQWLDKNDSNIKAIKDNENIKEELADVIIYCINFALSYGYDISTIIDDKLRLNGVKYAINKENGHRK